MRKRFGKVTAVALCLVAALALGGLFPSVALGQTGLRPYWVSVVDEFGNTITESTTVSVTNAAGAAQTVYSDVLGTAIGSTLTARTDGQFKWWGGASSYSVVVTLNSSGLSVIKAGVTPTLHTVVVPVRELSVSYLTLADGKLIIGDSDGDGAAQTISGDITISNAGVGAIASGVIVNADINASAAVAASKLAVADGKLIIGGAGGAGAEQTISGDITISNAGVGAIASDCIVNADVNSAAAIAGSKLQELSVGANAGVLPSTGVANAHVAADAAVALSKLAAIGDGYIIVGADTTGVPTAVTMSGDVTISNLGATTIGAGKVSAAMLATAVQDVVPYLTVTGADDGDGTGTATIQFKDAAGNDLAERCRVRTWIADGDFGAPSAKTDFSVTTGTQLAEVVANADYEAISDASGTVVMNIDCGGADTVYVLAEVDGRIYSSGAINITSA